MGIKYTALALLLVSTLVFAADDACAGIADDTANLRAQMVAMKQDQVAFYQSMNERMNGLQSNVSASLDKTLGDNFIAWSGNFQNQLLNHVDERMNPMNSMPAYILSVVLGYSICMVTSTWRRTRAVAKEGDA